MARAFAVACVVWFGCGSPPHQTDAAAASAERCFDGIDNNGDGLVDCADPSCASVAGCVAAVPWGWTGHTALYDGAIAGAPSCAAPFATAVMPGNAELTAAPSSCAACVCCAPNGVSCPTAGGAATASAPAFARVRIGCEPAPALA